MVRHLSSSTTTKSAKLFRNNRSQAVRIPVEFELPGDHVLIHREGDRLIIEPVTKPMSIIELLSQWRKEPPLGSDEQFPVIEDLQNDSVDIF